MSGIKHDADKARYELLPPEFLAAVTEILTFGAKKYSDRNWEKGIAYSRVFGALMRHLWAWWARKDTDPETGKSHLWHAGCCLAFLVTYETREMSGLDDRPTHGDKTRDDVLRVGTPAPFAGSIPNEDIQSLQGRSTGPLVFGQHVRSLGGVEVDLQAARQAFYYGQAQASGCTDDLAKGQA